MQKNIKTIKAVGAAPTPEERKEQAVRAFLQKRNTIAEMVISQTAAACYACGADKTDAEELVEFAIAVADAYMQKALGVKAEEKNAQPSTLK